MTIENEGTPEEEWGGSIADLMQLQSEFQGRILDETVRYLRNLQGALGPVPPGTVLKADEEVELTAEATPGGEATLTARLENRQRVHTAVSPQIKPLVTRDGTTWMPSLGGRSASHLLAPGATESIEITILVPENLPPGRYRGALLLVGFRRNAIPVSITVDEATESDTPSEGAREEPASGPSDAERAEMTDPEEAR